VQSDQPQAAEGTPVKRDRRQEYIDAAAIVFYERGYDTATLGDLADVLGVTKAAVYYYVDGKEQLLYEIIREMHLRSIEILQEARDRQGTALLRLWAYFEGHARLNLTFLEKTTLVYRDLDHLSPDKRHDIVELRDQTQTYVRDLLTQAIHDGVACTLLNVDLASIQMFASVNAMHSWYRRSGPVHEEDVAKAMTDSVLASVACSGARDRSCPRHNPFVN
jgi:AcrR family transcriptional regulator